MTNVPRIHAKSETVNAGGEVTVKTEEIDDGSIEVKILTVIVAPLFYYFYNMINIACDHGASESALCEPSSDPHLSHKPSTSSSSTTSKQFTSQVATSDNAEIYAFESTLENDIDSLSNQDSESPGMNDVFSELQREEELEYEEIAQNSTAHGSAAIPFAFNNKKGRKRQSWDENFKDLVDFKAINGHVNVTSRSGPLGRWVNNQRSTLRRLKEGKHSILTNDRCTQLESIGFEFKYRLKGPPWDQRFQELVDFKKINGHTNVPRRAGPLGRWVSYKRAQYCLLKEGKHSTMTNDQFEKLESIGFVFV
eukprot:scaffold28638_cov38-Attheya_sp.AAC.1